MGSFVIVHDIYLCEYWKALQGQFNSHESHPMQFIQSYKTDFILELIHNQQVSIAYLTLVIFQKTHLMCLLLLYFKMEIAVCNCVGKSVSKHISHALISLQPNTNNIVQFLCKVTSRAQCSRFI